MAQRPPTLAELLQGPDLAGAQDVGDDWFLNSSPSRLYDLNRDILLRMKDSPWAPYAPGAASQSRMPHYQGGDILNRQDFPPSRTRGSY